MKKKERKFLLFLLEKYLNHFYLRINSFFSILSINTDDDVEIPLVKDKKKIVTFFLNFFLFKYI